MVKQVIQMLNQEIKDKACKMCTHFILFNKVKDQKDNINICNKHLVKIKDLNSSYCKGKDFEVGDNPRFKSYTRMITNIKYNSKNL